MIYKYRPVPPAPKSPPLSRTGWMLIKRQRTYTDGIKKPREINNVKVVVILKVLSPKALGRLTKGEWNWGCCKVDYGCVLGWEWDTAYTNNPSYTPATSAPWWMPWRTRPIVDLLDLSICRHINDQSYPLAYVTFYSMLCTTKNVTNDLLSALVLSTCVVIFRW